MRVSREQFRENRENILAAAARLFRERGFEEVGVADVMKAAGLTHGGFYGHFKSKDDLIAQASAEASRPTIDRWAEMAQADGPQALQAIAAQYLGEAHSQEVGTGCLIAALGPEVARRPGETRSGVTTAIKRIVQILESITPGRGEAERRRKALQAYASWVGAIVLARISDDEAFSREVREAVAEG